MKVTVKRMLLLDLLGKVRQGIGNKGLPIANCVLVEATDGKLVLTGTNLESALTVECKAAVQKRGSAVVLPKPLEAFLRAVSSEQVELAAKGKTSVEQHPAGYAYDEAGKMTPRTKDVQVFSGTLKVTAGNAATTLESLNPKDFPNPPKVKKPEASLVVPGLATAIASVDYATCREESRPILTGINVTSAGKSKLELAAADGFRLAVVQVKARGSLTKGIVVPRETMNLVKKIMPDKVSVETEGDKIVFRSNGASLTSTLIGGTFPNYKQLVPKGKSVLRVETKALASALKVVQSLDPDSNTVMLFSVRKQGLPMLMLKCEKDGQTTEQTVPCTGKIAGGKIAFQIPYLKDFIARAGVILALRTESWQTPAVHRDNGSAHVIMPIHLSEWIEKKEGAPCR